MLERVVEAAIALVASEQGAFLEVIGDPKAAEFEPWPAMDALMAALDAARPGWRAAVIDREAANGVV